MKKRLVSITLATTMLLSLTACGSGNSGGAAGTAAPAAPETAAAGSEAGSEAGSQAAAEGAGDYKGTVMLYSSTDEGVIIALKEAFEKKYPNVTLDYYAATSGKCVTKLATEFQSGTVACDLAWLAAVSYTHLDVYKRQTRRPGTSTWERAVWCSRTTSAWTRR